ncbi:proline dehydrogenase family protein [Rhodococcus sp. BGS-1C]|jgi:proline dehydrogenase|uniref:proline dehydrogenase family protein n=1 Tax=unclassified Rhodococcus (in: high G+C Gram-positive bacteria) TaxID=192944 RepID=UPI00096961FF|nr:proline dehydrogenase family protein [Rhodococcus sp. KRD197]OLT31258.1 proline dehydrogenase [Rhodococcus sp. CUA-806]
MTTVLNNPLRPALLAAARSPKLESAMSKMRITRQLVDRFVAGESEPEVVAAVASLLESGRTVSVDYLGEDTTDAARASATVEAYLSLLQAYSTIDASPRSLEVSLKLSALGQGIDRSLALRGARTICAAAEAAGVWVTVDAEDHTTTDSTLSIVRELRQDYPDLGTVLQAYLERTEDDCRELSGPRSRIRLCKGAYNEPASVAFQKPADVSASYLRCLRVLMNGDGYPMVASHDPEMIDAADRFARESSRGTESYEYQMLYGIRELEQQRLVAEGNRVRVYVPYGDQWYGYFMRRLAERPANLMFFFRSLVSKN